MNCYEKLILVEVHHESVDFSEFDTFEKTDIAFVDSYIPFRPKVFLLQEHPLLHLVKDLYILLRVYKALQLSLYNLLIRVLYLKNALLLHCRVFIFLYWCIDFLYNLKEKVLENHMKCLKIIWREVENDFGNYIVEKRFDYLIVGHADERLKENNDFMHRFSLALIVRI